MRCLYPTDSTKIKKISEKFGPLTEVPFLRSKKLSDDKTGTGEVAKDFILKIIQMGYKFKNVCLIYPTAICTDIWHLKKAKSMIKRKNLDYVFFAKEYEHPIERAFYLKKELTKAINFNGLNRRSQDLKKKYYDAGQFYYGPKNSFLEKKIPMNSNQVV